MKYRHELDGLRGFAAISVFLFHTGFTWFRGGYVGVDVFFVISGYLITLQILAASEKHAFSLLRFYERRARRILPALYFVLLICIPFAYECVLPSELKEFATGLISIVLFSSNFLFWTKDDYFAERTELNPLIHTWALAILEQFYILFPLLFIFVSKAQKRSLIYVISAIALSSLILAQWSGNFQLTPPFFTSKQYWFSQTKWSSFFLPTGRIWELLIGALAAFYSKDYSPANNMSTEIVAGTGLAAVLYAIVSFDSDTPSPSFYTLVPTLGTILIIVFGRENTWIGRLLSMRILRGMGLISYSTYLWYQPLLAFVRITHGNSFDVWAIGKLYGTLLLFSYITWRFVEQPCRNRKRFSHRQIFISTITASFLIFMTATLLILTGGAKYRLSSSDLTFFRLQEEDNAAYLGARFKTFSTSEFQFDSSSPKILIVGDSFAMDFVNMAGENRKLSRKQVRTAYVDARCQIYFGKEDKRKFIAPGDLAACDDQADIRDYLWMVRKADIIILAASWRMWSAQLLPETIRSFKLRSNQTLLVVGPTNFGGISPSFYWKKTVSFPSQQHVHPSEGILRVNQIMQATLSRSVFINVIDMLCGQNYTCPVFTPIGNFISFDGTHLSREGALYVGKIVFKKYSLDT